MDCHVASAPRNDAFMCIFLVPGLLHYFSQNLTNNQGRRFKYEDCNVWKVM